jgi:hypothetical protein
MHVYGSWRRRRGGDPSLLATFWGGATFALAMGLARSTCTPTCLIQGVEPPASAER